MVLYFFYIILKVVFTKSADYFELKYENSLVFEDAEAGIEAAKNGRIKSIGVGSKENFPPADFVINDFSKFTYNTMMKKLNNICGD